MTDCSYAIFDGLQWNSTRGLARYARQLRRHIELAPWRPCVVTYPKWPSSLGKVLISELIEPYRQLRLRPDVAFHPHNVLPTWLPAGQTLRVLVLHDLLFLAQENSGGAGNLYRRLKLGHSLRMADLILTVSDASRAAIQKLQRRDTSIFVVPNCLAEPFAKLDYSQKQSKNGQATLLHFGGYVSSKNTLALMRAVAQLVREGVNLRLEVAAMADRAALIERWRNMVDLPQSSLQLLPVLTDKELIEAYRRADIHIMPSTGEGFGIPVIEAARAGTLNVLTPLEVFHEIIGDDAVYATGFNSEAIASALRTALVVDRRSIQSHAYERTNQYTFESVHERYAKPVLDHIAALVYARKKMKEKNR